MKPDRRPAGDWQTEVWRVKEELAEEARKMGLPKYLAYLEEEADRIMSVRACPTPFLVRDEPRDE